MASTVLFSDDHDEKASSSGSSHYEHWPEDFRSSPSTSPKRAPGYDSHNGLRTHVYEQKKESSPQPAASAKKDYKDKNEEAEKPKPAEPRVIYVQAPPQLFQSQQQPFTYYPSPQYVYGGALPPQPMMMHDGRPVQVVYAAAPAPAVAAPATSDKQEKEKKDDKKDDKFKKGSPKKDFTYVPKKSEPKEGKGRKSTNPWIGRTKAEVDEDNAKIAKAMGAYEKRKVVPADAKPDQPFWVVENDGSHTLRYV